MNDEKHYKINLEDIKKNYRMSNGGVTHNPKYKFRLLPYTTDESKQMFEFNGVIGAFSRMLWNKELKSEFNVNEFIENVVDEIGEFEGVASKETFKNIVKAMFIDDEGRLINFDVKTINYISSTNEDKKFSKFLYSIFFDEELKYLVKKHYDIKVENILNKLVLRALPKLEEQETEIDEYKCYLPFIKELFLNDFKFIIGNEELYKNSLKRLLEYYYMFYISQVAMKLSKFEKADLTKTEPIYYTLSWESTSKNRTAYKFGWDLLSSSVNKLFSHAITLDFLNHHGLDIQLTYTELFEIYKINNEEDIENQIEELLNVYINSINDVLWNEFGPSQKESGNKAFNKVYKLFECIDYQFNKSKSRNTPYNKYKNKFANFVYKSFGKRRGALGYSLNLTEEDIILMTKICINNNEKLKLSVLFDEFEKRGMFFDRDSKIKIVQLYEKLNLIEKKSDSGDAQYVRSVL